MEQKQMKQTLPTLPKETKIKIKKFYKDVDTYRRILNNTEEEVLPIKDLVNEEDLKADAYSTGFKEIDFALKGGFRGGDLVIISGLSGHGKTLTAMSMTFYLCQQSIPCLWFSYEVSLLRLHEKFKQMDIGNEYALTLAPKKNTSGQIEWIKKKIEETDFRYGLKVVFIDHIDFLVPRNVKTSDNQAVVLKQITTELKELAIEMNIIIVLMAHLKKLPRGVEEAEMNDIGSSAGIFQLADYVFLINRLRKEDDDSFDTNNVDIYSNESKIKLVKNRLTGRNISIIAEFINYKLRQKEYDQS